MVIFYMSLQPIGYWLPFLRFWKWNLTFLRRDVFFSSGLTWASLKFWGNVLVSIEVLIMTVMGVNNMSRQFFNTLVGMGSRSHDFDDELKINFLIPSSDARSRTFILDLMSVFLHLWNILYFILKFGTDSFSFIHKIPGEMITKLFYWCEFWQSRRWNSMQNVIYLASAKYFDFAFVIILLHRWHWCL